MKILILAHNVGHDNGGGVFTRNIMAGAKKYGHDVELLTQLSAGVGERSILGLSVSSFVKNFFEIRKSLTKADIVHVLDLYPYALIAAVAGFGLRKKMIITLVGSGSIIPLYSKYLFLYRIVCKKAATLTAISSFVRREVLQRLPGLSISVITPGINVAELMSKGTSSLQTHLWKPYIISVGSLRWRKGYKYSIRAFKEVTKNFPDLKYIIVGKKYSDVMYAKLVTLIQELDLKGKVIILDSIDSLDDIKVLYHGAELFFILSQNKGHDVEGFGMVFLEAAAAGLPVVGSSDCGVSDAMKEGVNGYLVTSDDVDGAAQAVSKILKDPELKKRMGEASKIFAKTQDWAGKLSEYEELYQRTHSRKVLK